MHSPNALGRAVADEDLEALTLVPGVGKRTAERLLVELRARLELPVSSGSSGSLDGPGRPRVEVREALSGLGYGPEEVREVLARLPESGSSEDLLRDALKMLAVAPVSSRRR